MAKVWHPPHKIQLKALFIHDGDGKSMSDIEKIAKRQALNIGFAKENLLRVRHVTYLPDLKGWVVVVQSLW